MDTDNDGNSEYAPMTWATMTDSGSRYPPVIGSDGVLYQWNIYEPSAIARMIICGWKFGTKYISRINSTKAIDEPIAAPKATPNAGPIPINPRFFVAILIGIPIPENIAIPIPIHIPKK